MNLFEIALAAEGNAEAAKQTTEAVSAIANVNFQNPSWDLFIVIFFVVATFLYGLSLGTSRIAAILFSTYTALAVVQSVPFFQGQKIAEVGVNQFFVANISMFVGTFIVLFFLISRSAITRSLAPSTERGNFLQIVLFSILQIGLLISIILSFLPADSVKELQPLTLQIFASKVGHFTWVVLPIIALALFAPRKRKSKRYYDYDDE
ncbi:MAG: hypothetical protein HYV34_01935 [Candidatus Kerfeldbacteria bacterium]|nr:hypothetical protein [Candidatus Kerfeldbacteria bacterium]